ncbi:mRNA export factor Gle1 [Condylostylus longicornis]|uniref:mRNA export factor Gle1 n=1 Tax=Condylostylus longicornis TaxID=2530218 RepID=UPI00244DF2D8|nr:mRNA export factor Gle1 [Condylostylus longicornis]
MEEGLTFKNSADETVLGNLINNIPIVNLPTLIRAAKVSPLIKDGRTIGPNDVTSSLTSSDNEKEKILAKEIKQKKTINNEPQSKSRINLSSKSDLLDINIISNSIAAKVTERTRKENIKKELEQRLNVITIENKKRQELIEKSEKVRSDWIQNKIESDKEIYKIAEEYIENEIRQDNKKLEKILNEKQRRLQKIALEAIVQRRKKFTSHYEKVCQSLKLEKNLVDCEEYNKNLKDLATDFEKLIQKIKSNNMGQPEILAAESLCSRIENLEAKLYNDISKRKQPTGTPDGVLLQKNCHNLESSQYSSHSPIQSTQRESSINTSDVPDSSEAPFLLISLETWNVYSGIITYFNDKVKALAPLENDPNMKKFLAACRRKINIPVAAICAVSPQHMQDKFDKLMSFILGSTKKQTATDVHVSEHPLAADYCIRYLAKKFIDVAGTEISSNSQAAFPFASIIIAIWNRIPDFGKMFIGQMYTESVFLVPFLFSRSNFLNDVHYKLAYGYYVTENASALEDFSAYNKRQAGIVRLFAAIMVSHGKRGDMIHPFPIENGWKWLSNLINIKPEMHDVIATIIVEFLQIAAFEMLSLYGKQFKKLLVLIQEKYLPKLNEIEDGKAASKGKLEQTLDLILKFNRIEKPQGVVPKDFW